MKVIILSSHDEDDFIARMIDLGANGYMLKTAEPNEIDHAIRSVAQSGFYFSETVNKVVLHGLVRRRR